MTFGGPGFTEWTNVTKAQPMFRDYYQPHLPADFGFYDLRVGETRGDRIAMTKNYGIDRCLIEYQRVDGSSSMIIGTFLDVN